MQAEAGLEELARRGTGMAFTGQYGAIAARAVPDARFAILATHGEQVFGDRTMYAYHAMYCHLTRLGCAPAIVAEHSVAKEGIPAATRVLFVVRQQQPLDAATRKAIEAFQAKGGKVVMTSDSLVKLPGAIVVDKPVKHIWQIGGFEGRVHGRLWKEFEDNWRKPLAEAVRKTGVPPLATTDPDRGIAVCLEAGPVRYVVVIADKQGAHSNVFEPIEALPVSLEGTGWTVRDLVKQRTLAASEKDGRAAVAVDLLTEPTTVLAVFRAAPNAVRIEVAGRPALGGRLGFRCSVLAEGEQTLGPVPVRCTLEDSGGAVRGVAHAAAGDALSFPLPALDQAGAWKLTAQELIGGVAATAAVQVAPPAKAPASVAAVGEVHVVNAEHLRAFAKREGEKLVIVEAGQGRLLPAARKLTAALASAGAKARLWEVQPEDFDSVPIRWYPRPEDVERMKAIEAGKLIGWRESLKAYINKKTRQHEPERGGYTSIDPPYMVGQDCVVFSGGALAESLRAVTPWMSTPNVPGKGQGRLVVCFSPFLADRQAAAVVGNDAEGIAKAAERLAAFLAKSQPDVPASKETPAGKWAVAGSGTKATPVPRPYGNFTPIRRVRRLLASRGGRAALLLNGKKDTLAFVDEQGKLTATVAAENESVPHARIDAEGRVWDYVYKVTARHPGWHFPTACEIRLRCIGRDGALTATMPIYAGATDGLPPDYRGGFPVAPDGKTAAMGCRAGMRVGTLGQALWRHYDDLPHVRRRFEVRTPRFPVGATFSPEGRFLFFTMDTRPRLGGMGYPQFTPTACEALLLDTTTGEVVWRLREDTPRRSPYAALTGFAAVARGGTHTALADFDGVAYVVDKQGNVLVREQGAVAEGDGRGRRGPTDGVGVWIAEDGSLAAFGFKNLLLLAHGKQLARVALGGMTSGCVSGDGSLAIAALESGRVRAFSPDGKPTWTARVGGVGPQVGAVGANHTLVATSEGHLVLLDAAGKELRRTNVAEAADREQHPLRPANSLRTIARPQTYFGPGTLELAKKLLGAKELAAWQPAGEAETAFGRTFHAVAKPLELAAPKAGESFVHMVYRRPPASKTLRVVTEGKDGRREFVLDLPTPEYREVDIPVRGPGVKVTVLPEGAVQLAECSLWGFQWPGPNIAYVRPPESKGTELVGAGAGDVAGALSELEDDGPAPGAMKDCRIWFFNTDPDVVAGAWIRAPVSPLAAVDGRRFESPPLKAWAFLRGAYSPYRGAWLTVTLGTPVRVRLAATYDRSFTQSELAVNLSIFSGFDPMGRDSGTVLAGAVENDQFWRLFRLSGDAVTQLGAHAYVGDDSPCGLSEVEAYR